MMSHVHSSFRHLRSLEGRSHEKSATVLGYCIFVATGVAIVVPGTLLPTLLVRSLLNDAQAGALFFCFFIGSSFGALLARGRLAASIVRGVVLTAAGVSLIAVSSRIIVFVAMLVFGLGLGMVMTSVSLFQSRRRPAIRIAELTRLNLVWAVGAALGPAIVLRGVERAGMNVVLWSTAAIFLLFGVSGAWLLPKVEPPRAVPALSLHLGAKRGVPWRFIVMISLATGVEAGIGAWLTTYSARGGFVLHATIDNVTCFWMGLLLSRLMQSSRGVAARFQPKMLRWAPLLMIAGSLLLIVGHGGLALVSGALLAGLGVGPLYPLLLALVLNRGEARNLAFLAAGIGSSILPLLTGFVSSRAGSLKAGLIVLLAASVAIGLLAVSAEPQES